MQVPDEEDRYFTEMDAAAKEYEQVMGAGLEKVVRRLIKRYSGINSRYNNNLSYRFIKRLWSVGGSL